MPVNPIPDGYPAVIPSLSIDGAADAIDWYTKVLGATERMRMTGPDGRVGHAELELPLGGLLMVNDEYPEMEFNGPKKFGGSPVAINVYVDDIDAVFKAAIAAGATSTREPENQFYGDRSGQFTDPWGHRWSVGTHVEDVAPDEMAERAKQWEETGEV